MKPQAFNLLLALVGSADAFQTHVISSLHNSPRSRPQPRLSPNRRLPSANPYAAARILRSCNTSVPRKASVSSNDESAVSKTSLDNESVKSILSALAFVAIDGIFQQGFAAARLTFPSSLAGCAALLASLLLLPSKVAEAVDGFLRPGAALLAQWLPVLFVPSLITLPLAATDHAGSAAELLKLGLVVVAGFGFSLLSTAYAVLAVRRTSLPATAAITDDENGTPTRADESSSAAAEDTDSAVTTVTEKVAPATTAASKAFSDDLFRNLVRVTTASAIAAVAASWTGLPKFVAGPLTSLFLLSTTLSTFVFGARLPPRLTKAVHPLVTCSGLTWAAAGAYAAATRQTFFRVLKAYRSGSLRRAGAGDVLLFLLGPAVVSLAVSMYSRRRLVRENLREVGAAVGVATGGGLFGTALAVRWLDVASPYLRLSLLSRNITSPLAMAIAGLLGADVSFAVSIVVVTGLIGANFGASLLDLCGIKDPVARGLGMGAAAHGLGTAAFAKEKDAFPFAAIAMALTASAATVTVSVPFLRKVILQLALG